MIKKKLNADIEPWRITKKKYNKEIKDAVSRIDKGVFVKHKEALKELTKW